jgi:hypothetical protein
MTGLIVHDLLKLRDVLLTGLNQCRVQRGRRIASSVEKVGSRQGQHCQEVAEHAVGIPGTTDQDLADAATGILVVCASGRYQVARAS